jgi:hypothetical protein
MPVLGLLSWQHVKIVLGSWLLLFFFPLQEQRIQMTGLWTHGSTRQMVKL